MTMPEDKGADALKNLAAICNGWIGAGSEMASAEAKQTYGDFYLTLDAGQRKQFMAFLGAAEFWKDGKLGINTISPTEIAFMQVLERKLFDFSENPKTETARQMSEEFMMAVRHVREACQFREIAVNSRGGQSRTPV